VEQLRVDDGTLFVEGLPSSREVRLFLGVLLGGTRVDDTWRIEPKARTLDELCVQVNRWLVGRGFAPQLVGAVDVSVARDAERRRSFERAMAAATALREGSSSIARNDLLDLLDSAGWNTAQRQLREHQIQGAIHALSAANAANFSVPGAGKTATTLAAAAAHAAAGNIDVLLVVGPLSSFQPWESETAICLPAWTVRRLTGNATERRRAIRSVTDRSVLLTSYPGAVSDNAALKELCRSKRVMLVADESHRIKRFNGGQWAPAVIDIAALATSRMILTGTPMPQTGLDLYSQLNVLWPGKELTGSKAQFKPDIERHFGRVISRVLPFVTRTSKAELGLAPPIIESIEVALSAAEAEIYDQLRNHLRRAVQAANPTEADQLAALRRGRPMRLLQAATNPALLKSGGLVTTAEGATPTLLARIADYDPSVHSPAKFVAAGQIIQRLGPDDKCVVWSNFIRNLDQFARFAREQLQIEVFQVDGRVAARAQSPASLTEVADDDESRERVIARFLNHRGKALLVTNPASCSESISLHTTCRNAIYLDRTYDCAQWLQSIDRIHRLGLPPEAQVHVYVLRSLSSGNDTADHLVEQSLSRKETRMLQLLQGAELSPIDEAPDAAEGTLEDMRALLAYLLGRE
jgi:SNF2 family DNA or RNA helicase